MPLGPQSLFVAVQHRDDYVQLLSMPREQLLVDVNTRLVEKAIKFVWGADRTNMDFIAKHFGANNQDDLHYLDLERTAQRLNLPTSASV